MNLDNDMPAWLRAQTQTAMQQSGNNLSSSIHSDLSNMDMDGEVFKNSGVMDVTPRASNEFNFEKPKQQDVKQSTFGNVIEELISRLESKGSNTSTSNSMELLEIFYPNGIKPSELEKAMFIANMVNHLQRYSKNDDALMDIATDVILRLKKTSK